MNKTQLLSSRRLPIEGDNTAFGGITSANVIAEVGGWVAKDAVGTVQNPKYSLFDARMQYVKRLTGDTTVELSIDVFNVLNRQSATRLQDLVAGTGTTKFLGEIAWVGPRRAFLSARLKF